MRERLKRGGALQVEVGEMILGLERPRRGHGVLDAAHAAAHLGGDLQELEPDGAKGGDRKLGVAQAEPEPQLVGPPR
jgi:hypothetical protein